MGWAGLYLHGNKGYTRVSQLIKAEKNTYSYIHYSNLSSIFYKVAFTVIAQTYGKLKVICRMVHVSDEHWNN